MGQYECTRTNKAAELEKWLEAQVEALKRELTGATIEKSSIIFQGPFEVGGQKYNNGFFSLYVLVEDRAPQFLNETDEKAYWGRVKQSAEERFGVQVDPFKRACYASYNFSEPSEDELYVLTENKKTVIESGLRKIKDFVSWIRSCSHRYKELVADEHQNALLRFFKLSMV